MRTLRQLFVLALVVGFVVPSLADDAEKGKKKRGKKGARGTAQAFQLPKGVELNEEQKGKVEELRKEFGPKLQAANKKVSLTADQRKAMAAARKSAAADGKKGKAAQEAIMAAANLSDEQKAGMAELNELRKEIRGKLMGLLTPEQKSKLRGGGKKKPKKADAA